MGTDFTQDTVLHYLQSSGGSVKNSDLLLHFKGFIRDHADQDTNRDLFKKFVNSVATVQQIDGVSYVVLRKKYKGHVSGGGEGSHSGPARPPAEKRPKTAKTSKGGSTDKSRQKPQPKEASATPAPAGDTAGRTVLPAAGIMLNNNNNIVNKVEPNVRLKEEQQQIIVTTEGSVRPAAAAQQVSQIRGRTEVKPNTPNVPEHRPAQFNTVGQHRVGYDSPPQIIPEGSVRPTEDQQMSQIIQRTEVKPNLSYLPEQGPNQHRGDVDPPLRITTGGFIRPTAQQGSQIAQRTEIKPTIPNMPQHPRTQYTSVGQQRRGFDPRLGITPEASFRPAAAQQMYHIPERRRELELNTPYLPLQHHPAQYSALGQQRGGLDPRLGIVPEVSVRPAQIQPVSQISERKEKTPYLHESPPLRNAAVGQQHRRGFDPLPGIAPVAAAEVRRQVPVPVPVPEPLRTKELCLQPEGGLLRQGPPLQQAGPERQLAPVRRMRHRPSYKSAVSCDDDDEEEEEEEMVPVRRGSAGEAWPPNVPLGDTRKKMSSSSPCVLEPLEPPIDVPSSSMVKNIPMIYIQDVEPAPLDDSGSSYESASLKSDLSPVRSEAIEPHHDVHMDLQYSPPAGVQLEPRLSPDQSQRASMSSSHSNTSTSLSNTGPPRNDWPSPGSSRGTSWNSSCEDLQSRAGKTLSGYEVEEVLQRAQKTNGDRAAIKTTAPRHHSTDRLHENQEHPASLSPFHHSNDHIHSDRSSADSVFPRHVSTGDLYDDQESSDGSTSSPLPWQHPSMSRRLRSRMCRSMGADLDQILLEEERGMGGGVGGGLGSEAARLNRLHMISSSLSLRYNLSSSSLSSCSTPPRISTPPRSHSPADPMMEGVGETRGRLSTTSSMHHPECSGRQSQVPLESREHAWMVKGAAGVWPDIYSLFREDPSLLNRQDFISGFTILHWIAKHGDHRVLNTLWYGVEKVGLTFDVNARSTCGHTPLHVAVIHGHKNLMSLLVKRFKADVRLRDTAGKRPWQYLDRTAPIDFFQLLGAPSRALRGGGGGGEGVGRLEPVKQEKKPRRLRHHLSMASSRERPLTISGTTRVKRSSSIAAYLKHKSMLAFHGHKSATDLI